MSKKNVLNVKNMNVSFKSHGQEVKAVRGVSFSVDQGEIVGLVGESGSGKSVTMKAVMGILPDNAERTAESPAAAHDNDWLFPADKGSQAEPDKIPKRRNQRRRIPK